jgi:hypothetical protein
LNDYKELEMTEQSVNYVSNYVGIGFCQPKFYTPAAWYRAKKVIQVLIAEGYAIPHNYGHGAGKFSKTAKAKDLTNAQLAEVVLAKNPKIFRNLSA